MINFKKFQTSEKSFIADQNRLFLGVLPLHLAHKGGSKSTAQLGLFLLDQRQGNTLIFKTGKNFYKPLTAKVLTNTQTGQEICFIQYKDAQIMLEAPIYKSNRRRKAA